MADAEPRNKPTPIAPPSAIIWMWRSFRPRWRSSSIASAGDQMPSTVPWASTWCGELAAPFDPEMDILGS
jgi:hypothetical protein